MKFDIEKLIDAIVALFCVAFVMSFPAAWITHIFVCLKTGEWGFLIAGALFLPIGIIHGIGVWFGVW
jgi:hypothetical protein